LDLANPQYTSPISADGKIIYAHDGLTYFKANPDKFDVLVSAKFDEAGLMASEATYRRLLKLDELELEEGGAKKSEKLYHQTVGRYGPLKCATPAIADGLVYIRLNDKIACYDFRAK